MMEMNKEAMKFEKVLNDYINDNHLLNHALPMPGLYAITVDNHIAYIGSSTNVFRTGKNIIWDAMNGLIFTFGREMNIDFLFTLIEEGKHRVDVQLIEYSYENDLNEWAQAWIDDIKPPLNSFCDDKDDEVLLEEINKMPIIVVETKGTKEIIHVEKVD